MAIQVDASLDSVKRLALQVILQNVNVRFADLKNSLMSYISSGQGVFESLMYFAPVNRSVFASSGVSASLLLAYLDFYALYSLVYSNYAVFDSLKNISISKYQYIYNLYKSGSSLLSEKELLQDYKYVMYCSFDIPTNIDIVTARSASRSGKSADVLTVTPALMLPIENVNYISPSAISFTYTDGSENIINSDIGSDYMICDVLRLHGNKMGVMRGTPEQYIKHIIPSSSSGYSINPEISGSMLGHFTTNGYLYLSVDSIVYVPGSNTIASIIIKGSTNGYDFSSTYAITPGIASPIYIEQDIDCGLSIILRDGYGLDMNDKWTIQITNIDIGSPSVTVRLGFGMLEPVSYIKYTDSSRYRLLINSDLKIKNMKYGGTTTIPYAFSGRAESIVVVGSSVSTLDIDYKQDDYDIYSENGQLYYRYDFNFADIQAAQCYFKPHGVIAFNKQAVSEISTIAVSATSFNASIPNTPDKLFIEYNIIVENELGRATIPMVEQSISTTKGSEVFEYVLPTSVEFSGQDASSGLALYTPRFPVGGIFECYNVYTGELKDTIYDATSNIASIFEYQVKFGYTVKYQVKIGTAIDTCKNEITNKQWIYAGSNIYYMYFLDEGGNVFLAIRALDKVNSILKPFTGNVTGQIEMRSIDKSHITPMVFNYSLACI